MTTPTRKLWGLGAIESSTPRSLKALLYIMARSPTACLLPERVIPLDRTQHNVNRQRKDNEMEKRGIQTIAVGAVSIPRNYTQN